MNKLSLILVFLIIISNCSKSAQPIKPPKKVTVHPVNEAEKSVLLPDASKAVDELKKELGNDFIVDYVAISGEGKASGFAVAGNISQREFNSLKNGTVKACSAALFKDYFDKKPDYIIKVYLFDDASSYESYCKKTLGRAPSTPYGFYQDTTKSLIMNISTGGGTLVHEMVHAMINPDFPDVPAWFNEGLGSLYEQCHIQEDGSLRGLINWRYKGLMESVKDNTLVPLKEIFSMTNNEFYGTNSGIHYAQTRYFCLYLQENKVLTQFYKKFRDGFSIDKTGIKFIEELLQKPIGEIDKNWQEWIKEVNNIESLK